MNEQNRQILEDGRKYHALILQGMGPYGISYREKTELVRVISEEFHPGFTSNLDCDPCINDLVVKAYMFYDKFLSNETSE